MNERDACRACFLSFQNRVPTLLSSFNLYTRLALEAAASLWRTLSLEEVTTGCILLGKHLLHRVFLWGRLQLMRYTINSLILKIFSFSLVTKIANDTLLYERKLLFKYFCHRTLHLPSALRPKRVASLLHNNHCFPDLSTPHHSFLRPPQKMSSLFVLIHHIS